MVDGKTMISLTSATWGSAQVISTPAPSTTSPGSSTDSSTDRQDRRRPAMVIRRRPVPGDAVEVGPADPAHPSGRVDIYL
jgi:hypothetical protein